MTNRIWKEITPGILLSQGSRDINEEACTQIVLISEDRTLENVCKTLDLLRALDWTDLKESLQEDIVISTQTIDHLKGDIERLKDEEQIKQNKISIIELNLSIQKSEELLSALKYFTKALGVGTA